VFSGKGKLGTRKGEKKHRKKKKRRESMTVDADSDVTRAQCWLQGGEGWRKGKRMRLHCSLPVAREVLGRKSLAKERRQEH